MGKKRSFKIGEQIVDIPEAEVGQFLSDVPDAKEVQSFVIGKDTVDIPVAEVETFKADVPEAKPLFEQEPPEQGDTIPIPVVPTRNPLNPPQQDPEGPELPSVSMDEQGNMSRTVEMQRKQRDAILNSAFKVPEDIRSNPVFGKRYVMDVSRKTGIPENAVKQVYEQGERDYQEYNKLKADFDIGKGTDEDLNKMGGLLLNLGRYDEAIQAYKTLEGRLMQMGIKEYQPGMRQDYIDQRQAPAFIGILNAVYAKGDMKEYERLLKIADVKGLDFVKEYKQAIEESQNNGTPLDLRLSGLPSVGTGTSAQPGNEMTYDNSGQMVPVGTPEYRRTFENSKEADYINSIADAVGSLTGLPQTIEMTTHGAEKVGKSFQNQFGNPWKSKGIGETVSNYLGMLTGAVETVLAPAAFSTPVGAGIAVTLPQLPPKVQEYLMPVSKIVRDAYDGKPPANAENLAILGDILTAAVLHVGATGVKEYVTGGGMGRDVVSAKLTSQLLLNKIKEIPPEQVREMVTEAEKRFEATGGDQKAYTELVRDRAQGAVDELKAIEHSAEPEPYNPEPAPESLRTVPEGADVEYEGKKGTLDRGDDGTWYFTDDEGNSTQIPVEDKYNPQEKLSELGIQVLPEVSKEAVARAVADAEQVGEVEYKGKKYFVSLDNPMKENPTGDLVFERTSDGRMLNRFDSHPDPTFAQNRKLAIVNKFLEDKGLPHREALIEPWKDAVTSERVKPVPNDTFTNRVFESNVQLGEAPESAHISQEGLLGKPTEKVEEGVNNADVESTAKALEIKNEGKAEIPTKESVTERLNINNPFYKKVEDALVKLGLIEKYNPETKTGDVIGGYVQSDGRGGFASGDMYFEANGVIKYRKDGNVVEFDRNGNVISENTKQVAQENKKIEIEATKSSIASLEKTRDSEAFKYKEVTESDALGNRKKVKRLKTSQELKESTDKINAAIDKAKSELAALEAKPTPQSEVEATTKALEGVQRENVDKFVSDFANIDIPFRQENIQAEMDSAVKKQLFPNEKTRRKYAETIYSAVVRSSNFPKILSEAYHKAKADGSNPELVKAVEGLLGKPTEKVEEGVNNADVGSTAKALEEPSLEQQLKDIKEGNTVTFEYKNESEVPEIFKDKISSKGEINGKPYVKVTMAKSLADFHLQEKPKSESLLSKEQTPTASDVESTAKGEVKIKYGGKDKDLKGNPKKQWMLPKETSEQATQRLSDFVEASDYKGREQSAFIDRKGESVEVKLRNDDGKWNWYEPKSKKPFASFGTAKEAIKFIQEQPFWDNGELNKNGRNDEYFAKVKSEHIKTELENGNILEDINEGKISAEEAKSIIESAGLEIPKAVEDLLAPKSESLLSKEQTPTASDVESTAKALEGSSLKGIVFADKNGVEKIVVQDNKGGGFLIKNNDGKPQNPTMGNHKDISEAYHKAKADGSNPELVSAVEKILKPQEDASTIAEKIKEEQNIVRQGEQNPGGVAPKKSIDNKTKERERRVRAVNEGAVTPEVAEPVTPKENADQVTSPVSVPATEASGDIQAVAEGSPEKLQKPAKENAPQEVYEERTNNGPEEVVAESETGSPKGEDLNEIAKEQQKRDADKAVEQELAQAKKDLEQAKSTLEGKRKQLDERIAQEQQQKMFAEPKAENPLEGDFEAGARADALKAELNAYEAAQKKYAELRGKQKAEVMKKIDDFEQWALNLPGIKDMSGGAEKAGIGAAEIVKGMAEAVRKAVEAGFDIADALHDAIEKYKKLSPEFFAAVSEKDIRDRFGVKEEAFAASNAASKKMREELGIPQDAEFTAQNRRDVEAVMAGAKNLKERSVNPKDLVDKVIWENHMLNAEEQQFLVQHEIDLFNERKGLEKKLDALLSKEVDPKQYMLKSVMPAADEFTTIQQRVDQIRSEQAQVLAALEKAGSEQSLVFRMRQLINRRDYSVENSIRTYMALFGREPSQRAKEFFAAKEREIAQIEEQRTALADKAKEAELQGIIDGLREELAREKTRNEGKPVLTQKEIQRKKELKQKFAGVFNDVTNIAAALADKEFYEYAGIIFKETVGDVKNFTKRLIDELGPKVAPHAQEIFDRVKKSQYEEPEYRNNRLWIDPNMLREIVREGVENHTELSQRVYDIVKDTYPDVTMREVQESISGYGKTINPKLSELDKELNSLKRDMKLAVSLEDAQAGKGVKRSGYQPAPLTDSQREMMRTIREELKNYPQDEAAVEKKWKTALDKVKTGLRNAITDAEKRLEDLRAGRAVESRERKQIELDETAIQLKEQLADLKKQLKDIEGDKVKTPEQIVREAVSALERAEGEYQDRINEIRTTGTYTPKVKRQVSDPAIDAARLARDLAKDEFERALETTDYPRQAATSKALSAAEAKLRALEDKIAAGDVSFRKMIMSLVDTENPLLKATKEQIKIKQDMIKAMREASGEADRHAVELWKARKQRRIDELNTKKANKDFTTKAQRELPIDEEMKRLAAAATRAKFEYDVAFELAKMENMSKVDKLKELGYDLYEFPKSIMASMDLSAVMRQGGILSARHPIQTITNTIPKMLKMFAKESFHKEWYDNLVHSDDYISAKESGLFLNEPNAKITAREEQAASRIAAAIPGVGASNRAYSGFLNMQRMQAFSDFKNACINAGVKGDMLRAELRNYADFINKATGRGSFGRLETSVPILNTLFFAPRFAISRFQLLRKTLTGFYNTPKARIEAYKAMGSWAAAIGSTVAIFKMVGYEVNTDMNSSDFLKVKRGNQTYDPWSGMQQPFVLLARTLMGSSKSVRGEEKELNKGGTTYKDVWERYLRSKAAPIPGMIYDAAKGKTMDNQPFKWIPESGEDITEGRGIASLIMPMIIQETIKEGKTDGIPTAVMNLLPNMVGIGVQTIYLNELKDKSNLDPDVRKLMDQSGFYPNQSNDTEVYVDDKPYEISADELTKIRELRLQKAGEIINRWYGKGKFDGLTKTEIHALFKKAYNRADGEAKDELLPEGWTNKKPKPEEEVFEVK